MRATLHLNSGKLCLAQAAHEKALFELAQSVYLFSLGHGPDHIVTAPGYYCLGSVFMEQGETERALAVFDKVVDVWYKFLASIRTTEEDAVQVTDAQLAEVGGARPARSSTGRADAGERRRCPCCARCCRCGRSTWATRTLRRAR